MKTKQNIAYQSETKKAMNSMKQILLSMIFLLMMVSCGDNGKTASEAVNAGWDDFESGSLESAIENFEEAIDIDVNTIEAHIGLTYAYALLDQLNLAVNAAETGLDVDGTNADLHAAIGLIRNAQNQYANSNTSLLAALNSNPSWSFGHNLGLNAQDLQITLAQNFFALRNYEESLNWMQEINSTFNPNINTDSGLALLLTEIENFNRSISF